jgi:hypothetical protein
MTMKLSTRKNPSLAGAAVYCLLLAWVAGGVVLTVTQLVA